MVAPVKASHYYGPNGQLYIIARGEPIHHGPHLDKSYIDYMAERITFLEDPSKQNEPLPKGMFRDYELERINEEGRLSYALHLRKLLLDLPIG